ncbi:hypothetical protein GpartN1_g3432.t1 [Galdieria partita]|uniref:Uncharacterized protein n=1 Tax=Galdieria partita TaxID=83374 RepID=A0A9C7PXG4_9RHOD|nr:hypothetical protein GpartN1_g3432.t1 [Galdieria partita]
MDVTSACNLLDQVLGSSSDSVSNALRLLVTNLKQLHPSITPKLVEVLYMYPHETTPIVSQLTCGTEKEVCLLIEAFSDLLCSDRNLLVPIVSALGELPLAPKLLFEVRKTVVRALHTVEERDVPIVVRTLLRTLIGSQEKRDFDWIIIEIRDAMKTLEAVNLAKIWEVLDDCFRVSPVVCINMLHSWKRIALGASLDDFRFTAFDFCFILCSMQKLRTKATALEVLTAVFQRLPKVCYSSVHVLIRYFKPIISQHSNPFRIFATCILRMRNIRTIVTIFVTIFKEIKDLRAQLICDLNCAIRQSTDISYAAALCLDEMSNYEEFADSLCSALNVIEDLVAHPHSLEPKVISVLCRFLTRLHKHRPSKTDSIFILLRKQILFGDFAEKRAALALAFNFIPSVNSTESNILVNLLCNAIPPCIGHSETGEFLRFLPSAIEKLPLSLVQKLYSSYLRFLLPADCVALENGVLRYDVTRIVRMYPDNLMDIGRSIIALRCMHTRLNDSSNKLSGWLLVETMVSMLVIELASDKNSALKHMEVQENELLEAASSCVVIINVLSNVLAKYSLTCMKFDEMNSSASDQESDYLFLSRMEELKTMFCAMTTILSESRRKFSKDSSLFLKEIQKLVMMPCISVYIHSISILPVFSIESVETMSDEELEILIAKISFSIFLWEKLWENIDSHEKSVSSSFGEINELEDCAYRSEDRPYLPDSVCFKLFENIANCQSILPTLRKHISNSRSLVDHSFCSLLSSLFEKIQYWLAILLQILRCVVRERTSTDEISLCWDCLEGFANHRHSVSSLTVEAAIEQLGCFVEQLFLSTEEVTLACLSIDILSTLCRFPRVKLKVLKLYIDSLKTVYPVKNKLLSSKVLHRVPNCIASCLWYSPYSTKFFRIRKSTSFVSAKYQLISCVSVMSPQFALAFAYALIYSLTSHELENKFQRLASINFQHSNKNVFCMDVSIDEVVEVFISYFSSILRYWLIGVTNFEFHIPFYIVRETVCCLYDMLQLLKFEGKTSFTPTFLKSFLKIISTVLSVLMAGIDRMTKFPNKFKNLQEFPSRKQLEGLVDVCKKLAVLVRNFAFEFLQIQKNMKFAGSLPPKRRKIRDKFHINENAFCIESHASIENVLPSVVYHTESVIDAALDWSPVEDFEQSSPRTFDTDDCAVFKKYAEDSVKRILCQRGRTILREEDVDLNFVIAGVYTDSENNVHIGSEQSQDLAGSDDSSDSSEDRNSQSDSEFILIDADFQPLQV